MESERIYFADGKKLKPAIQLFVNEMGGLPEKWEGMGVWVARESPFKVAPCQKPTVTNVERHPAN